MSLGTEAVIIGPLPAQAEVMIPASTREGNLEALKALDQLRFR